MHLRPHIPSTWKKSEKEKQRAQPISIYRYSKVRLIPDRSLNGFSLCAPLHRGVNIAREDWNPFKWFTGFLESLVKMRDGEREMTRPRDYGREIFRFEWLYTPYLEAFRSWWRRGKFWRMACIYMPLLLLLCVLAYKFRFRRVCRMRGENQFAREQPPYKGD